MNLRYSKVLSDTTTKIEKDWRQFDNCHAHSSKPIESYVEWPFGTLSVEPESLYEYLCC